MSSKVEDIKAQLREQFVGKNICDVSGPAAIIDASIVKRNCQQMLDSCRSLGFGFRAHVKTHKVGGFVCGVQKLYIYQGRRLIF